MKKNKGKKTLAPNPLLNEELFDYLHEIIESSDVRSEEEMNKVLNSVVGQPIEKIRKRVKMTPRLEAKQLMYEAAELPETEGRKLAEKALEIYPDCVDAFIYYGNISEDIEDALDWYRKAVQAGEREIGPERFEKEAGHFWGVNFTRPYMRARERYASVLAAVGKFDEAISEYRDMLRLNPNDNQGVRFEVTTLLMYKRRYKDYYEIYKEYKNEKSFGWLYTYFLYLFLKYGAVKKTQEVLLEAVSYNPHILEYICNINDMPREPESDYYSPGDANEAFHYLESSIIMWAEYPKALGYLLDFYHKYIERN